MKRTHLPLNALRVFEAAARHLSFTRAADELAVTPAAVGQHIRALEDVLGLILFKRTARALVLTPEAQSALMSLREGFEKFEDAVRLMQSGQASSVLTITTSESFASKWLIPRLNSFYASRKHMQLRIVTLDKPADFTQENIDLAITQEFESRAELRSQKLMDEELIIVAVPQIGETVKKLDDIEKITIIHDDSIIYTWQKWFSDNNLTQSDHNAGLHFKASHFAIDAALAKLGAALTCKHLATAELATGRLIQIFEKIENSAQPSYYLIAPEPQWRQKKVQDFVQWIMAASSK